MKGKRKYLTLLILILIGVFAAAQADLHFKPFVNSYRSQQSPKWEQDARVLAEVWWSAPSPSGYSGVTAIDGSYFYDAGIFVYSAASEPSYLNECDLAGLSSIVDSQYRANSGSALFSRTIAASGNPIAFTQTDYKAYVPVLLVKPDASGTANINFNTSFAKALGKDTGDNTQTITGNYVNLSIPISAGAPPQNFAGPSSAVNINGSTSKAIGNTVKIDWTDLNSAAAPFAKDDTPPIKYDIYLNEGASFDNPANESKVVAGATDLSGNSKTLGGSGIPGTPVLKDKTTYYFRMRAKDSTTTPNILGKHKTTNTDSGASGMVSVHVNDYTAPEQFTINTMNPANKQLTVGWSTPAQNANDLAGYYVLRHDAPTGSDPALPTLVSASGDNDGTDYSGVADGAEIIAGTGWKKVKRVNAGTNQIVDTGLDNKTRYKYAVYAYDIADANQQGRNYSITPATKFGQPGEAPDLVNNFIAISSPEARQITLMWDDPAQAFYKGATVVYTTKKDDWDTLDVNSPEAADVPVSGDPTKGLVESKVLTKLGGVDLNPNQIYYFKAFSYNDAGMSKTTGAMAASIPALGGGGGPVTITLTKISGGMGVNSIGIPAGTSFLFEDLSGSKKSFTVSTLQDLIAAINSSAGAGTVTASAYWDGAKQQLAGASYSATGSKTYSTAGFDETKINLAGGKGYYLSVSRTITFKLSPR